MNARAYVHTCMQIRRRTLTPANARPTAVVCSHSMHLSQSINIALKCARCEQRMAKPIRPQACNFHPRPVFVVNAPSMASSCELPLAHWPLPRLVGCVSTGQNLATCGLQTAPRAAARALEPGSSAVHGKPQRCCVYTAWPLVSDKRSADWPVSMLPR